MWRRQSQKASNFRSKCEIIFLTDRDKKIRWQILRILSLIPFSAFEFCNAIQIFKVKATKVN